MCVQTIELDLCVCFRCRGHRDPQGQREIRCAFIQVVSFVFLKPHWIHAVNLNCVLQGEKGIGLAGPPGRVGPQGLKVSSTVLVTQIAKCGSSIVPLL